MMDAGIVAVCELENTAADGDKPVYRLVELTRAYFEQRTVSYRRLYAARGANQEIDLLIRIWRDPLVQVGQYAVLYSSVFDGQYEIQNIQHTVDADNLKISDLTLKRIDRLYEIAASQTENRSGCSSCHQH